MTAPVFDACTQGTRVAAVANTTGSTFTHAGGTGSNLGGVLAIVDSNEFSVGGVPTGTPTATYGGVSLTYLGSVLMGNTASAGFIALFSGTGLPTGSQSVTWSMSDSGQTFGNLYPVMTTFTGVGSIGPMASAFQSTTARSVAVPSNTGNTVWGLVANRFNGGTLTSPSFTARKTQTTTTPSYTCGELSSSASSTTVSATDSVATEGAAVGVELRAIGVPAFDNSVVTAQSGGLSNTYSPSWSHTVGSGANNCGIVAAFVSNGGSVAFVPTGTPTASIGSKSLTYLGSVLMGNTAIGGFIAVWAGLNVPTGSQTVTFSISDSGQNLANGYGASFTYTGVGGIGALQTAFSSTSTNSVTVPSAASDLVWGAIANYQTGTYSSPSFAVRQTQNGNVPYFVAGDQAGASSVNFTATQSSTFASAAVGLDLRPVSSTPTNQFFVMF
jgi:hypothetical protein